MILTSNSERDLGDALKRRCLHLHIGFPEQRLEERIVESRVPGISQTLRRQMVGFIHEIRTLDLKKLPSVSETIDWARVLVLLQATELDTRDRQGHAQRAPEIRGRHRGRTAAGLDLHRQGGAVQRLRLTPMRENLHRFFRAARGAGVRVSPAESIDAMRAVARCRLCRPGHPARHAAADARQDRRTKSSRSATALICSSASRSRGRTSAEADDNETTHRRTRISRAVIRAAAQSKQPRRPAARSIGPACADAAVAGSQRDRSRDGQRVRRRLAVRHPLFHPARHLLQPHPRRDRHRSGCATISTR